MYNQILHITVKLLSKNDIRINSEELKQQLLSHPDLPSLAAISDTLTNLGVENLVCQIQASDLSLMDMPFLAVLKYDGLEQVVLVKLKRNDRVIVFDGTSKKEWEKDNFLKYWEGIILAVQSGGESNKSIIDLVLGISLRYIIVFGTITFSFLWIGAFSFPFWQCLLGMAGIWVVVVLWHAEQGDSIVSKFCNLSTITSCQTVLESTSSKLFGKVSLTLISFTYFTWQVFSWLLWKQVATEWMPIVHWIAIPITFYTLWQQAFVIKKWCPLCLVITTILWVQAIISILHYVSFPKDQIINFENFDILQLFTNACLILLVAAGGNFLQSAFASQKIKDQLFIENLSFRRNYHLFLPWFNAEKPILDSWTPYVNGIISGKNEASLQLIVITNPLCEACQRIHYLWEGLIEKYQEKVKIEWRFYVPYEHLDDPRTMIASWLLKQWQENAEDGLVAFHNWYRHPNLKAFDDLRIPKRDLVPILANLKAHNNWCKKHDLKQTPLLLINGRRFPQWYRQSDIEYFLESLLEGVADSRSNFPPEMVVKRGVMLADT